MGPPWRRVRRPCSTARRWADRGLARSDIVAIASLGLCVLVLAVPTVWVSRSRIAAVSALGRVIPRARDEVSPPSAELRRLQTELVRLEDERRQLEDELFKATEFARRARAVALDLGRLIEASVIGHSMNWQEASFLVDRGTVHGVVPRAGCLSGGAAVGVVVEVGPEVARVAVLGEPGVRIAARTLLTRRSGLLVGTGDGCELRYVDRWSPSRERPRPGEALVTTGRLGFFPPGFLLGRIEAVGDASESLHLSIGVVPEVKDPPLGTVWILKPLPDRVDGAPEGP
jgi:cell shape-determining protein MreC